MGSVSSEISTLGSKTYLLLSATIYTVRKVSGLIVFQKFCVLSKLSLATLILASATGPFCEGKQAVAAGGLGASTAQSQRQEEAYLRWQIQQLPPNSYQRALVARRLAENLELQNRWKEAAEWYQYSVNLSRKFRDDRAKLLRFTTEIRLARLHRALGAFAEARSRYEEIFPTIQTEADALMRTNPATWTSEHVQLMITYTVALTDAIDFYREMDQLNAGEKYLGLLVRIASRCTEDSQPRSIRLEFLPARVISAYLQAEVERARLQCEKAREMFEEAKDVASRVKKELENAGRRDLSKEVQALEIPILVGLGLTFYDLGQLKLTEPNKAYEKASTFYTQALERMSELPEEDRVASEAQCRKNRGILYHEWAKLVSPPDARLLLQAQEDLEFAAAYYSKRAQKNPHDLVHTYNSLGLLLLDLGKAKEALDLAQQGAATLEGLMPSFTSLELRRNNLMLLARSMWLLGQKDPEKKKTALDYAERAIESVRELSMRCVGDPFSRAVARQRFWGRIEGTFISWCLELSFEGVPLDVARVLKIFEQSRGQSLLEEMRLAQGWEGDVTLQPKLQTLQVEIAELNFRINQTKDESERKRIQETLRVLDRKYNDLIREFWTARGEESYTVSLVDTTSSPDWVPKVESWIRKKRLLLLMYLTDLEHTFLLVLPERDSSSSGPLWELKLTKEDETVLSDFGDKSSPAQISSGNLSVAKLRQILSPQSGLLKLLAEKESPIPNDHLRTLGKVLIPPPVLERIVDRDSYDLLAIVADGPLGMLPFQTLIVPHGAVDKFLVEVANPILYLPSLTVALAREERPRPLPTKAVCFAKASFPEYQPEPPSLPAVIRECNQVAELFRSSGLTVEQRADVWPRDRSATKEELARISDGAHILHLATHGVGGQEYGPWGSCLLLSVPENSPLRAGLLTLTDIYRLPLRSTELVLLSACHTRRGVELEGEGIWGVARGFVVAGARQTLATVWAVDSEVASYLIPRVAEKVSKNLRASSKDTESSKEGLLQVPEALREAQLEIKKARKEWEHPFFWAPFVVVGTP